MVTAMNEPRFLPGIILPLTFAITSVTGDPRQAAVECSAYACRFYRDDGAALYLNGKRVFRTNLAKRPDGTIDHTDLAKSTVGGFQEENRFHEYEFNLPCSNLVNGENVLAAEVHQASTASSDVSFDLELATAADARITRGPYLQLITPHSVILRWETDVATHGYVRYAKRLDKLAVPTQSVQTPLPAHASTRHEVQLQGLIPNTTYYYVVGMAKGTNAADLAGLHTDFYFTTTPKPVDHTKKSRIWVLGDSGANDIHAKSVKSAYLQFADKTDTSSDLWLMLGDNAYYHGTRNELQAALFDMYPEELRHRTLWSAIGNHDADTNPEPYFDAFNFPTHAEAGGVASGTETYYSFRYNNIHFVALDSVNATDESQIEWLAQDLNAARQDGDVDWIVALFHHAPYSKGTHDSDNPTDSRGRIQASRRNFLPLLDEYGVDLVLSGHSHVYERSFLLQGHYQNSRELSGQPHLILNKSHGRPINGGYKKPVGFDRPNTGIVYVVAGSGSKRGAEGSIYFHGLNHPAMVELSQPGRGSRRGLNVLGSVILEIDQHRLQGQFIDDSAEVRDHFAIDKGESWLPQKQIEQLFLRSSHNSWQATDRDRMRLISHYTWEMETGLAAGDSFKFDIHGDWSRNYGDNNIDGFADNNGQNIPVTQGAGTYRIRFNTQSKRYTVEKLF